MKLNKRITPLTTILVLSMVIVGVGAVWYWTSEPMTMTISVVGLHLDAKANVNPLTAWDGLSKVAYGDLVEEAVFFAGSQVDMPEGPRYIFARIGPANANSFYTKVNAAYTPGMLVSCTVSIVDRRGNVAEYPDAPEYWHDLGPIAIDGSQTIQLIGNGDPLYMLGEPSDHMRYAMYAFTVHKGSLPPGDHTLSVEISIGDDL